MVSSTTRPTLHKIIQRLLDYEIWVMVACTGLAMISSRFLLVSVLTGLLFWSLRWVGTGFASVKTPVDGAVLVLLLMLFVSLWATGDRETTEIQLYRVLNGMFLFYSIVNWGRSVQRLRLLLLGLVVASVFLALFAAVSVEWDPEKIPLIPPFLYERFVLLVGDTVHRNVMGGALVLILPISAALVLFSPKQLSKIEYGGVLFSGFIVLAILILTQSRGALAAFFFAALFLFALRWKRAGVTLFVFGVAGFLFFAVYGFQNTLSFLTAEGALDELPGRLETWYRAGYMIQDFPFTGIGMGTFGPVAEKLYPFILQEPGSVPHAHNLFLQVAVDLGIPGLVAWLAILIRAGGAAWQVYLFGKVKQEAWLAGVGAGLLASHAALILHGLFDAVTWGMVRPAPLVWAIWGLMFAFQRVNEGHLANETAPSAAV